MIKIEEPKDIIEIIKDFDLFLVVFTITMIEGFLLSIYNNWGIIEYFIRSINALMCLYGLILIAMLIILIGDVRAKKVKKCNGKC
jgi:hypothetical protein